MLRSDVAVTTLGNKIYAVGGFNGATGLKSAECYDPELNIWQKVTFRNNLRKCSFILLLTLDIKNIDHCRMFNLQFIVPIRSVQ